MNRLDVLKKEAIEVTGKHANFEIEQINVAFSEYLHSEVTDAALIFSNKVAFIMSQLNSKILQYCGGK